MRVRVFFTDKLRQLKLGTNNIRFLRYLVVNTFKHLPHTGIWSGLFAAARAGVTQQGALRDSGGFRETGPRTMG